LDKSSELGGRSTRAPGITAGDSCSAEAQDQRRAIGETGEIILPNVVVREGVLETLTLELTPASPERLVR
jgi:hypothetical protein